MSKILIAVGILIIGFALSPFGPLGLVDTDGSTSLSSELGLGANDTLAIPREDLNKAIKYVETIESTQIAKALSQQRWSDRLLTLVIVMSGLISIGAGTQRILKAQKKSDLMAVYAIAVLSAAVAVTTSLAGRIENRAKENFKCIGSLQEEVRATITDVKSTDDADIAGRYLKELKTEADRCGG